MTNKLYVANVPFQASEDALRAHFSSCGGVLDVEIISDRDGKSRGMARVTMTSPAFTTAALGLDGTEFEGRKLRVSDTPIRAGEAAAPKVKIVLQFRERENMAYDLDCRGVPLTLRIFQGEGDGWRVEARTKDVTDGVVVTGFGPTKRQALADVVRRWNESTPGSDIVPLDGDGLFAAMHDVRAV
ncbi:MAG TPA: hypothetical protein VIF62_37405 [Labilithrix sp.]